jgi:hypothetical protein
VAINHITGDVPAALSLAEPDAILSFGGDLGRKVALGEHSVDARHRPKAINGCLWPDPAVAAKGS